MRTRKIAWIVFALVIGVAVFWWTTIKKKVVKDAVTKVVQKKTDSLYRVTYDTSEIDELGGNVYLRNVQVRLDSAQWAQLVLKDSMPPVTLALTVDKITIRGLKEIKLLSNSSLDVSGIVLENPVFRLDKWLRKKPSAEKLNDTLEVYKRLIGNFDFLRAKNIQVVNGHFTLMDQLKKEVFSAHGININIEDFLVDSTHNYTNIISYFIKQTRATVNGIAGTGFKTGNIVYDSKQHVLTAENVVTMSEAPFKCKKIDIAGLSTEDFITRGAINARRVLLQQPDVVLKPRDKTKAKKAALLVDGSVDSLVVEKGSIAIHSEKSKPVFLNGVNVVMKHIKSVKGNIPFEEYANASSLKFSIGLVKIPVGFHLVNINNILYPAYGDQISIAKMEMKPTITRQQLKTHIGKQADMYNLTANNIMIDRIDLKKMIRDQAIDIQKVTMQMNLHVFADKTLPVDSVKKGRGRFPYEGLMHAKKPIDIRAIEIKHATIAYEEATPKTEKNGTVFFTDVNGVASNATNIPALLANDNVLKIEANAKIMDAGRLQSHWRILLNSPTVEFRITGEVAPFSITALSPPFEALSLTKMRSGTLDKLDFTIDGNRQGSQGTVLLNYHDLKIDLLKKDENDSLVKKGFLSFLANADVRNKNQSDKGKDFTYKRDRYKSFFNLLWKSIFEGGKKTILIVH